MRVHYCVTRSLTAIRVARIFDALVVRMNNSNQRSSQLTFGLPTNCSLAMQNSFIITLRERSECKVSSTDVVSHGVDVASDWSSPTLGRSLGIRGRLMQPVLHVVQAMDE